MMQVPSSFRPQQALIVMAGSLKMRGGRIVSIRQSDDSRVSAPLDLDWFGIPSWGAVSVTQRALSSS